MIGVALTLAGISKLIYDAVKEEKTAMGRLNKTVKYISGNTISMVDKNIDQSRVYEDYNIHKHDY